MGRKWFDVTVTESYHHTYKVIARDEREADDLVNTMVNNGDVDPAQDGSQSYARKTDVEQSDEPKDGDEYWEFGSDDEPKNWLYQELKETKASKRRRKLNRTKGERK